MTDDAPDPPNHRRARLASEGSLTGDSRQATRIPGKCNRGGKDGGYPCLLSARGRETLRHAAFVRGRGGEHAQSFEAARPDPGGEPGTPRDLAGEHAPLPSARRGELPADPPERESGYRLTAEENPRPPPGPFSPVRHSLTRNPLRNPAPGTALLGLPVISLLGGLA